MGIQLLTLAYSFAEKTFERTCNCALSSFEDWFLILWVMRRKSSERTSLSDVRTSDQHATQVSYVLACELEIAVCNCCIAQCSTCA